MKSLLFGISLLFSSLCSFAQYSSTDTISYYSEYFNARKRLKISLPEKYNATPNQKYKVIYLFDGQSTALYNFTKASLAYFPGYASFYYDPVILVGIETSNRHFEFLPKHLNTTPGPQNYAKAGGADTLAMSMEKEIKPFIEKTYRTNGYAIGIGHSLGATFVTYTMLKYPKVFNAGICISPNYVFDNEAIFSVYKEAAGKNSLADRLLYIGYGKGDETEEKFRKSTIKFGNLLKENKNRNFHYQVEALNNYDHSTTAMEGIPKGLTFINDLMNLPFSKYKRYLNADSSGMLVDYIKGYFATQSKKTGAALPSIGELNSIAYNVFYSDRKKEAIQLLEWGTLLYPDDSNLFDSMGELQENVGNSEKAKYYYTQALAIVESQKDKLPATTYQSRKEWFTKRLENIKK